MYICPFTSEDRTYLSHFENIGCVKKIIMDLLIHGKEYELLRITKECNICIQNHKISLNIYNPAVNMDLIFFSFRN